MNQTHHAIILLLEKTGEQYYRIHYFSESDGYRITLKRASTKSISANLPDIFQIAELSIETKKTEDTGFLREFKVIQSFNEISKHYDSYYQASLFLKIIMKNASHMDDPADIFSLLQKSLEAWKEHLHPEVIYLKSLYLLAQTDGFPVAEGWRDTLPQSVKNNALSILKAPLAEQNHTVGEVKEITQSLTKWLTHFYDFQF